MKNLLLIAACLLGLLKYGDTQAHEVWANGTQVPQWVKGFCCGVADAHRLTVQEIRHIEGGWAVDGFEHVVPDERVLPSQDEFVWIFYQTHSNGVQSQVFCFFVPQGYD